MFTTFYQGQLCQDKSGLMCYVIGVNLEKKYQVLQCLADGQKRIGLNDSIKLKAVVKR